MPRYCATTVAQAAPTTPMPSWVIKYMSSVVLTTTCREQTSPFKCSAVDITRLDHMDSLCGPRSHGELHICEREM
jgi:hypothetical protein